MQRIAEHRLVKMGYFKTAILMAAMTALFMGLGFLLAGTGGMLQRALRACESIPSQSAWLPVAGALRAGRLERRVRAVEEELE